MDQTKFGAADQIFPRLVPAQFNVDADTTRRPARRRTGRSSIPQPRRISNLIVDQTADNPAAVEAAGRRTPRSTPIRRVLHPQRGPRRRPVGAVQLVVHAVRPVLRPRPRPGQQGRQRHAASSSSRCSRTTRCTSTGSPTNFMVLTRATARRRPRGHQPDVAVRRPEPDLHLAPVAPGLPARRTTLDAAGEPASDRPPDHRPGRRHGHVGRRQGAGRDVLGIELTDRTSSTSRCWPPTRTAASSRGPNGFPQLVVTDGGGLVEGDPATAPDRRSRRTPSGPATPSSTTSPTTRCRAPVGAPRSTPDADADVDPHRRRPAAPRHVRRRDARRPLHRRRRPGQREHRPDRRAPHLPLRAQPPRRRDRRHAQRPAPFTAAELAEWTEARRERASWSYGERLFQAARFVTEMEYQHLAFEEFIRKVQPMVNLFGEGGTGYHTDDQPGDPRRVRPRRLPLRPLDAHRDASTAPTPTAPRTTSRCSTPSSTRRRSSTRRPSTPDAGGRQHRARHDAAGRQRARRVRHRGAAQPAPRPARWTWRR